MYPEFTPSDIEAELDGLELELSMLDQDLSGDLDDYGVVVSKNNYNRLVKKIEKLKGKLKGASGSKANRLKGRLKTAKRKLARMRFRLKRQVQRRRRKGKDLKGRQKRLLKRMKGRRKSVRARKQSGRLKAAHDAAVKLGWPTDRKASEAWLYGAKLKNPNYFYIGVYRAYINSVKAMQASGKLNNMWAPALQGAVSGIKRQGYRAVINRFFYRNPQIAQAAEAYVRKVASGGEPSVVRQGTMPMAPPPPGIPVISGGPRYHNTPFAPQQRMARMQQMQAQRQAQMQQMQAQRQAQMQAQQQASMQQAANMARQRALWQAQLQAQQQASTPPPVVRSGAFQTFPSSSAMQPMSLDTSVEEDDDMMMDEDGEDGEDTGDDGADLDSVDDMGDDETPFYKKPIVLLGLLGAGAVAWQQYQKKSKKKGVTPKSPADKL